MTQDLSVPAADAQIKDAMVEIGSGIYNTMAGAERPIGGCEDPTEGALLKKLFLCLRANWAIIPRASISAGDARGLDFPGSSEHNHV